MLPSECPNCGRLHEGHSFVTDPGPVQKHLRDLATAALALVGEYENDRSDSCSDAVNAALAEIEEAGYLRFKTVVSVDVQRAAS